MITKSSNVRIKSITPELVFGLMVLDEIFVQTAGIPNRTMVVTSVNDSTHKAGSLHYEGRAADIRTHGLEGPIIEIIVTKAKAALGLDFNIVYEKLEGGMSHIHLEYDPK